MPRTSSSKKGHNTHRHENGLVGPGKRITKQKSNGQINGVPKGQPPDTPPLSPILTANPLLSPSTGNTSSASLTDPLARDPAALSRVNGVGKRASESSLDQGGSPQDGMAQGRGGEMVTKPRSDTTTSKRGTGFDVNPFHFASTVIRSCPLGDTIAILIVLLQLPPVGLTMLQVFFAWITFAPQSGLTLGSLFSFFDVFHGSAGTPSLWTMIMVDTICLGGWYCLWTWARNFALDLAQVQVAITFSGGNSGKSGGVNTFCVALVLLLHVFRSSGIRQFFFDYILSTRVFSDHQISQVARFVPRTMSMGTTTSPSWLRSLFAIHIIAQAGIAMVRRHLHASQAAQLTKPSKRNDTEAAAGITVQPDPSSQDAGSNSTPTTSADMTTSLPLSSRDGKERVMTVKKRRRQAHQVRSRQPVWAAIASTKVTVMRDYEHLKQTSTTGRQASELAELPVPEESVVWISSITPTAIRFEASETDFDTDSSDDEGNGNSKPFYVRINGAYWTATSIIPVDEETENEGTGAHWKGEIAGLAPNCTYTCSFVKHRDDQVFSVVTVKTPVLPDTEQSTLLASPPGRQLQRPSSPSTTLKNSISTAEAKLAEARNRLTRTRRAHKSQLSKLEKEVDSFSARLKASSDDTKQRQKLLQAERSIRQTEDATSVLQATLEELAVIPEEETEEWTEKQKAFDTYTKRLAESNTGLEKARSAASDEVTSVNDEFKTLAARKERLTTRQKGLGEKYERIVKANTEGLNEKERKAGEIVAKDAERSRIEANYHGQFAILNREWQSAQVRYEQICQQLQAMELATQQALRNSSGPLTPEGPLPGTQSLMPPPHTQFGSRPFGYSSTFNSAAFPPVSMSPDSQHTSPYPAYSKPSSLGMDAFGKTNGSPYSNGHSSNFRPRPRSSSNRSGGNISNFSADFEDADPIPPTMPGNTSEFTEFVNETRRKGSGSASASASSRSGNNSSPVTNLIGGLASPMRAGRASPGQSLW